MHDGGFYAQEFEDESRNSFEDHHQCEDGAGGVGDGEVGDQQGGEHEGSECGIELGGVDGFGFLFGGEVEEIGVAGFFQLDGRIEDALAVGGEGLEAGGGEDFAVVELVFVGVAAVGELDGPGDIGFGAVAAAVEEAADATEGQADHQAGGDDVHAEAKGDFFDAGVDEERREGEDESAVVGESAAGDVEHLEDVLEDGAVRVGEVGEIFEDVGHASAEDAGEEADEGCVGEEFAIEAGAFREIFGEGHGAEETDDHHEAEAVDGDVVAEEGEAEDVLELGGIVGEGGGIGRTEAERSDFGFWIADFGLRRRLTFATTPSTSSGQAVLNMGGFDKLTTGGFVARYISWAGRGLGQSVGLLWPIGC